MSQQQSRGKGRYSAANWQRQNPTSETGQLKGENTAVLVSVQKEFTTVNKIHNRESICRLFGTENTIQELQQSDFKLPAGALKKSVDCRWGTAPARIPGRWRHLKGNQMSYTFLKQSQQCQSLT